MASIINASSSGAGGLISTGDSSGSLQLQSNGVTVATIAASGVNAGIQMGAAFAPAFSAYQSVQQTGIAATTWTKITLTTENFDTNSNYASSRFTPTVAGYYQINGTITLVGANATYFVFCNLYKNGVIYAQSAPTLGGTSFYPTSGCGAVIYLNGSTDYVELYAFGSAGGSWNTYNTQENTNFSGAMIRSA